MAATTAKARTGLRLLETEAGFAENLIHESPELVEYEATRVVGQASRLAMLIRGWGEIDDETRLKKLAAHDLKIIGGGNYDAAKRVLLDADLLKEGQTTTGKPVLYERVAQLDHSGDFERLADVWEARPRSEKEKGLIATLDAIIARPRSVTELGALANLSPAERNAVLEVAKNASVIDQVREGSETILYSPLTFNADPKTAAKLLKKVGSAGFDQIVGAVQQKPGTDTTSSIDPLVIQAVRAGILPTYRVDAGGGVRAYSFSPYTGALVTDATQRTIVDKALALVACLRYANEASAVTRLKYPLAAIDRLLDRNKDHQIGWHSELKGQYGMLVAKGVGRVLQDSRGWFAFRLIVSSQDNIIACKLARELLSVGEAVATKELHAVDPGAFASGTIGHPVAEIAGAKRRKARADELEGLVELIQTV